MNNVFSKQGVGSDLSSVVTKVLSDVSLVPEGQIDVHSEFNSIGIDSLKLVLAYSKLGEHGICVSPADFMLCKTAADIIFLVETTNVDTVAESEEKEPGVSDVVISDLLPGQSWFLNEHFQDENKFNISFVYETKIVIESHALIASVKKIHERHLSLNKQFKYLNGKWLCTDGPLENRGKVFEEINLTSAELNSEDMFHAHCDRIQSSIDIESGVLFRLAIFRMPNDKPDRILIVIHHLACDGFSLSILRNELWYYYDRMMAGIEPKPSEPTEDNIVALIKKFDSHRQSQSISQKISSWLKSDFCSFPYLPKAVEHEKSNNLGLMGKTKTIIFSREITDKLVNNLPRINELSINHLLVAALNNVLCDWSQNKNQIIMMVDSGRTFSLKSLNFDASNIVGWLALTPPLIFKDKFLFEDIKDAIQFKDTIDESYESGIAYEIGYFINNNSNNLPKIENKRKVVLNFLGNRDVVPATEEKYAARTNIYSGIGYSPNNDRACIFVINAMIIGGQLKIDWNYNGNIYEDSLIEELTQGMSHFIESIIGCFSL